MSSGTTTIKVFDFTYTNKFITIIIIYLSTVYSCKVSIINVIVEILLNSTALICILAADSQVN